MAEEKTFGGNLIMKKTFKNIKVGENEDRMTVSGTITKTLFLFAILFLSSAFGWVFTLTEAAENLDSAFGLMIIGIAGGFILSLITIFVKKISMFTAPLYALFEGLFLGSLTALVSATIDPTIGINALVITLGLFAIVAIAYKTGFVKATEKFKLGVMAATGAIFLTYIVDLVLRLFGINFPLLHQTGLMGIGIQVGIIIIATLNIVLDFDFIEQASKNGAPKYFEWYGGFSLMVTLVWLYVEIIRLLIIIYGKKD